MADAEPFSLSGGGGGGVGAGRLFASAQKLPQQQQQQQKPAAVKTTTTTSAEPDDGESQEPAVVSERLRRRGNAAFAAGKYLRAGELYRRALDALEGGGPSSKTKANSTSCSSSLPAPLPGAGKLHSNLAAVALQMGRPRAALASCAAALHAEPTFGRAAVRAATCYVRLGEWPLAEKALSTAEEAAVRGVTSPNADAVAERDRVLADAAAKRAELAQLRAAAEEAVACADAFVEGEKKNANASSNSSSAALSKLSAVLSPGASPYALPARAARARLLLALGRPSDAAAAAAPACAEEAEGGELAWQGWVRVQAAFFEGRLGDAAAALEARAQAGDEDSEEDAGDENDDGSGGEDKAKTTTKKTKAAKHPRGLAPPSAAVAAEAAAALRSLLAARIEGNEAYAASKFAEADAAYSRALLGRAAANGSSTSSSSSSSSSAAALAPPPPAFAALLLANRGAARARAGDVAGALSDCLSARALAPGYAKAAARAGDLLAEVGLLDAACREYEEGLAATKALSSKSSSSPSSSSPSSSSSLSSTSSSSTTSTSDAALASSLRSKLQSLRSRIARSTNPAHASQQQQQQQQVDSFKLLGLHSQRARAAEEAARRLRATAHLHFYGAENRTSAEVARAISDADVRAAYRRAALAHHPDKATTRLKLSDSLCGAFGVKLLGSEASAEQSSPPPSSSSLSFSSSSSLSLNERLREAADFVFKAVGQARDALAEASGREAEDRRLTAASDQARARAVPPSHHSHSHSHSYYHSQHSSSYYGYGFDDFAFDARQQRVWDAAAQAQAQANTRRPYAW